jgi:hypothetical protein
LATEGGDKPFDPGADPMGGEGGRNFVADAVRKAVLTGLGAVFLTEEGARKLARDWKLPKEIVGYVTSQAAGARDEILRVVTEEVRKFFESEALRREVVRLVSSMSIEVHAEIRLKPGKKGRLDTEVKLGQVKPRFRKRGAEERPDEAEEPDEA